MVDPFKMKVSTTWPKVKCSSIKPLAQNKVTYTELFDFGSEAAFIAKVDNSVAGQMRDCAECHVGGGTMEYVMSAKGADLSTTPRNSLRNNELGMLDGSFNAYEYFIDQYDEDGDGILGEVIQNDYSVTGVMEMDCLMCHMEGYSWTDRKEAIRKGKFDASRSTGAGLGTHDLLPTTPGTQVVYDAFNVVDDGSGNAVLAAAVLDAIKGAPPSANCSSCHFDMHQVDWKKRGTSWNAHMNYETEVHASLGCMGCHERTDGIDMDPNNTDPSADNTAVAGNWTGNAAGAGKDVLGHDPTKQFAPYSSLWNANDGKGGAKTCESCHTDTGHAAYGDFGAADPTAKHEALGLTSIVGQNGRDGVRDASHLDFIACDACHTRKLGRGPSEAEGGHTHGSLYEWGTGGAMVDSTGADADGRLTDHESLYVERTMEDNLVRGWSGGKLSSRHGLITMFWRDKDDDFTNGNPANYFDVNADGQTGAMDAVNPFHVRNAMDAAGRDVLTHDGVIADAEIQAMRTDLYNYLMTDDGSLPGTVANDGISDTMGKDLDTWGGIANNPAGNYPKSKLKLSFMGVLFRANHGTSPASAAWGKGGCLDCHADGAGFYNGGYDMKPRDLTASWVNHSGSTDNSAIGGGKPKWKYVVPFTKVNKADFDGDGAAVVCSNEYTLIGAVGDIGNVCGTGGVYTQYAVGDRKEDWQFSDFHPTLWAKGLTSRSIAVTAAFGNSNTIRTADRSEFIYEKDSTVAGAPGARVMTDGTVAGGRTAIVANLNSVTDAVHNRHVAAGYGKCSTCHDTLSVAGVRQLEDVLNPGEYLPVATGLTGWENLEDYEFTYTPDPLGNPGTCSANACHGANGFSMTNSFEIASDVAVTPYLSALSNPRDAAGNAFDLEVSLNASRSSCDNGCSFSFDIGNGTCDVGVTDVCVGGFNDGNACVADADCEQVTIVGGATPGVLDLLYKAAGTYNAVVTVTDNVTGEARSVSVAATAAIVEDPAYALTDVSVSALGGACTVQSSASNIAKAYIYWGDRTNTQATAAELLAGVDGVCGASVRVKLYDTDHNVTNLSY